MIDNTIYEVKQIEKSFGNLRVLDGVSISFEKYKTTCILGESGTGKTTLLNIIAGIVPQDGGEVIGFSGEDSSFVFQEDRLIPWKNVEDNMGFVLKSKMCKAEIKTTTNQYLKWVNLEQYRAYYPKELSGGMRQRISILRAFIYPASILIMDEPFKSMDINNRQIVLELFRKLSSVEQRTCILVTHNIDEALALGDKIVVLSQKPTRVKRCFENTPGLDEGHPDQAQLKQLIEKELMDLKN